MVCQFRPIHLLFRPDWQLFSLLLPATVIAPPPATAAAVLRVPVVGCEGADVDAADVAARVLGEAVGMDFKQMGFEINFILKHDKLFLVALLVSAHKVLLGEVNGEGIIVDVVLLRCLRTASIAYMTAFVLVAAVRIQLVGGVEALSAEPAFGVAFESGLVFRARLIIAGALVLA